MADYLQYIDACLRVATILQKIMADYLLYFDACPEKQQITRDKGRLSVIWSVNPEKQRISRNNGRLPLVFYYFPQKSEKLLEKMADYL
jgi:hypothetical protein